MKRVVWSIIVLTVLPNTLHSETLKQETNVIPNKQADTIIHALNAFQIELPSWGFANTGPRFGKFLQPAAAATIEEKYSDAGHVHRWTGVCPTIALHVLWDLPNGVEDVAEVQALGVKCGLRAGSINPNTFQDLVDRKSTRLNRSE